MKKLLLIIILFLTLFSANAQRQFRDFHLYSEKANKTGMYVLGSWGLANMVAGGVGWSLTLGSEKYFHQMNFFWNTVNTGIAAYGLHSASKLNHWKLSSREMMDRHMRHERIFLINAGLDVVYVGTGLLLKQLAENQTMRQDMLTGYGNSVLVQGGFLFLFDGIMYLVQRSNRLSFLGDMNFGLLPGGAGVRYVYNF